MNRKAKKFDKGKVEFSNVPRLALYQCARVMTQGKEKYGQFNYSGKIEVTRLTDALERHLHSFLTGDNFDESGCSHLAHIACNALMALDASLTGKLIDNRNQVYKNDKRTRKKTV